jgi:hypothetical protein
MEDKVSDGIPDPGKTIGSPAGDGSLTTEAPTVPMETGLPDYEDEEPDETVLYSDSGDEERDEASARGQKRSTVHVGDLGNKHQPHTTKEKPAVSVQNINQFYTGRLNEECGRKT